MKISKSLFKQLSRCNSFYPLYNIYLNKANQYNLDLSKQDFNKSDLDSYLKSLNLNYEDDLDILDIIEEMFDSNDLLNKQTIQLDTFLDTFNEIEVLVAEQLKRTYDGTFINNKDTFKQKKFTHNINEFEYYCYVDIYNETDDTIRIFEVKATTDLKFKELGTTIKKQRYSLFRFDNIKSILDIDHETINTNEKTKERLTKKYQELFDPYTKCGKYIFDIAIQNYIIENTKPIKKVEYYLVVLNSDYIFDGTYFDNKAVYHKDKNQNQLFTIIDVNDIVKEYYPIIEKKRIEIEQIIKNNTLEKIKVGSYCELGKTTECPFKPLCFKKTLVDYSILEIPQKNNAFNDFQGIKKPTIYDFINNGIYLFTDAYPYTTKPNYQIIYDAIVSDKVHIDKDRIKEGLKQLTYPIYHLDFESMNNPLPRFRGEKAYAQSVFQYSLHIERKPGICDIEKDHTEFLAKDHQDHREELIKQMISDIDLKNGGCVLVYNESFEKTRLKELAKIFPKYEYELMNIHDHIIDLLQIIKGSNSFYEKIMPLSEEQKETYAYYHKGLRGSFSIKKVLPIFTNLSYNDIEIHKGTEAVYAYSRFDRLTEEEFKEVYRNLLIYCRQDTWSMVEILRGLNNKIKGGN